MAEAVLHPIPSETTVVEDASSLFGEVGRYFRRNKHVFVIIATTIGGVFVNRIILRREIRNLHFNVEVHSLDDDWGDYGLRYTDDE